MDAPWTTVPNWLIEAMPQMPSSVFQVAMVIARQTYGYSNGNGGRKEWDRISLSQFQKATGLSRQGVIDAIENGNGKWFTRRKSGQYFDYQLVNSVDQLDEEVVNSVDQKDDQTSQLSRPPVVNSVDQSAPKLVNSVDPQKERTTKQKPKRKEPSLADADDDDGQNNNPLPSESLKTKALTEKLHSVGVALSAYTVEHYTDMAGDYGMEAVLRGITSAAEYGKQHKMRYVDKCIISAAQGRDSPSDETSESRRSKYAPDEYGVINFHLGS